MTMTAYYVICRRQCRTGWGKKTREQLEKKCSLSAKYSLQTNSPGAIHKQANRSETLHSSYILHRFRCNIVQFTI